MDVQLYLYDLSQGMARSMSAEYLGMQIDAIYHTSVVLKGVEYAYYDGGIQMAKPGSTYLGQPMQVLPWGKTKQRMKSIQDYLKSLKSVHTLESYDIWSHNCNNFANDFSTFLLGKGIPSEIIDLPKMVLDSPSGQTLKPQIEDMVKESRSKGRSAEVTDVPPTSPPRSEAVEKEVPKTAHPHESRAFPKLRAATQSPELYERVSPLDRLSAKLGESAQLPAVQGVAHFVAARQADAAESTLPDMAAFSRFLREAACTMPNESFFAALDLLRIAMADPRFSGYFAEEKDHQTIGAVLHRVNETENTPYYLSLIAVQMACNMFSSPLYVDQVLNAKPLKSSIIQLVTGSLLDKRHLGVRAGAATLAINISSANARIRVQEHREALSEKEQLGLAASLSKAISIEEESTALLEAFLLAFGQLVYCLPKNEKLVGLLKSMDAQRLILSKKAKFPYEALVDETKELLETL